MRVPEGALVEGILRRAQGVVVTTAEVDRIRADAGMVVPQGLCVVCDRFGDVFPARGEWWCMRHLGRLHRSLRRRGLQ